LRVLKKNRKRTWFEIVNLIVPGLNEDEADLQRMAKWVVTEIGRDVPFHFNRFEPHYELKNLKPTSISTLKKAHALAKKQGLDYVYLGNIPGIEETSTFCPKCGKKVVERVNFRVVKNSLKKGVCSCGYRIPGYWQ
jgi:pyruvate formate lyase activating enzyme